MGFFLMPLHNYPSGQLAIAIANDGQTKNNDGEMRKKARGGNGYSMEQRGAKWSREK